MPSEKQWIQHLYEKLIKQPKTRFPSHGESLKADELPGVYIIRKGKKVLHIGRTLRGKKGLRQRLTDHLHGNSSFTINYHRGYAAKLRKGHTYQYLVVNKAKNRAFLECLAAGMLCPDYIGLGEETSNKSVKTTRERRQRS